MDYRRAVVFPGQGTTGGEVSGEVREAVEREVGGGEVPYQLAVFASSVTLFYRLREAGVEADVVAGHSLGEYAAAHAAGALTLDDGVRLVAARDRLMSEASEKNPGGMVAVIGADPRAVEEAVAGAEGVVVAANYNTPRQLVVSGERDALDRALENVKGRKVPLEVVGAFHSPLMRDASERMERLLEEVEFREPGVPIVSAASGELLADAGKVKAALRAQMLLPVRWVEVVEKLRELGVREVVECGEGGTLVRMLRDFKGVEISGEKAGEVLA
ncbi:ACP S-malonyltransferase [Rubrobacter radiotolerans]|uniref:[acyl-carrier-protein] S-malonyltransferase n=1 Tax=Rubrobacter radiotolerans TaxID=42256 RepID=A0AB35TAX5_RUBRA|nr:ACP S-malonyltransferase [Rubrobacter radiotolerans]MDX5894075.1 ACP S-malonyltransferase [Rubrobacter radiotolerans]SMC05125.1 [acyl-carrier-protein] S-malonyltransferase [Rubrobacter radiotolerans DSM 5868]